MSDPSSLITRDEDGVRHLVLNRPERINAIDHAQHLRLMNAFRHADKDDSVRVVALSGSGRGFCAGDDLRAAPFEGTDPLAHRRVELGVGSRPITLHQSTATLRNLSKPTVALMHGIALGSGYDYSLCCDFRVVTPNIRYGDPRINLALWAAEGWSYTLPRLIGQSLVSSIAYRGEIMDGETALRMGLAHRVVSGEPSVIESSKSFLYELLAVSGPAYSATKRSMLTAIDASFDQAMSQNVESCK